MPAHDHLQPQQLRMFMRADEIMGSTTPGDFPDAADSGQWAIKEHDSRSRPENPMSSPFGGGRSLRASIEAEGVHDPVEIQHRSSQPKPILVNGHHRVATERSLDKGRYLPVEHSEVKERAPHVMPDAPPPSDTPRKFVM